MDVQSFVLRLLRMERQKALNVRTAVQCVKLSFDAKMDLCNTRVLLGLTDVVAASHAA